MEELLWSLFGFAVGYTACALVRAVRGPELPRTPVQKERKPFNRTMWD